MLQHATRERHSCYYLHQQILFLSGGLLSNENVAVSQQYGDQKSSLQHIIYNFFWPGVKIKYVLLIKKHNLVAVCLIFDHLITDVFTIIDKCFLTMTMLSDIYKAD